MGGNCCICGKWAELDAHHAFGSSNRKKSDKHGFVIRICRTCHDDLHFHNPQNYVWLKQMCQKKFEETHTRAEFIREFGKSYL